MKKEQKLEIGQQVKVSNRNQINYSREGKIIEKETSGCGIEMSNVNSSGDLVGMLMQI